MSDLTDRHCKPCEGGVAPLTRGEAEAMLEGLDGWSIDAEAGAISREFDFADFHATMEFVNAVAWIAHREDHHPDLEVGYRRCRVRYRTHAIRGLSQNDFICAAKTDALMR